MGCERKQYVCGVTCLFTDKTDLKGICDSLANVLPDHSYSFGLVFFSKSSFSASDIILLMEMQKIDIPYAACSTAGEITPLGLAEGELVIILFPTLSFDFACCSLGAKDDFNMSHITPRIATLKAASLEKQRSDRHNSTFALCLMDGMSYLEEVITAALHWELGDIPLLGGSAGDDLNFSDTQLILNGELIDSVAIVLLVNCSLPLQIFKTENFVPTAIKLVVTKSDPDLRIVYEFNGGPAAKVYAEGIGVNPDDLTPQSFASHPLVVRVGGENYCRSIQKVNEDGSLSFFCAIDDGIVMTVAEPTGMADTTQDMMTSLNEDLNEVDFILGFDCVLRQIDARSRQITRKISDIYQQNNIIGFNTYGEQYRSMHLNQTLTGVAFGVARSITGDQDVG